MEKVSVIVPVYNIEKYVGVCIESIVHQDYDNLEIILVNDGSTDSSLRICEEYAQKDTRIRIINGKNAGRGAARNRGVECATGDYVTFIDGDDFVDSNYVSSLVEQKKRYQSNIAITFDKEFNQNNNTYYVLLDPAPGDGHYDGVYDSDDWYKKFFYAQNSTLNTVCMKLFDRQLFNNIRFPERHVICEDAFTSWKLAMKADRISFENKPTYIYRKKHAGSITTEEGNGRFHYAQVKVLEESMSLLGPTNFDTSFMKSRYEQRLRELMQCADDDTKKQVAYKLSLIDRLNG